MASLTAGSTAPTMRAARRPALAALPMATVATGTPLGICRMLSAASTPDRPAAVEGVQGTPITGSGVMAATMPGRWAAPPAPAMMQRRPRAAAERAYSNMRSGVRCALTMVTSQPTPSSSSASAAARMVGRSLSLPIMMPTMGAAVCTLSVCASDAAPPARTASRRARTAASDARASAMVWPTVVMWPILRAKRTSPLSYQCVAVPGVASAAPSVASAMRAPSVESCASPRMLYITAPPTCMSVEPSGHPSTARTWFSNWEHWHASMV
mmetsp:Transcript_3420/g.13818  ORF Transcript_3420/g.13818 Transcript_3420/m.13818 type:complete len:268 (+) Transcript_3420:190-993(+)